MRTSSSLLPGRLSAGVRGEIGWRQRRSISRAVNGGMTMAKLRVVLKRPVAPTSRSANMPSCPPILAAADQRRPPPSRKPQWRRSLPVAPSTRRRNEKPLLPTNGERRERERAKEEVLQAEGPWDAVSRSRQGAGCAGQGLVGIREAGRRHLGSVRALEKRSLAEKAAGIKRKSDWKLRCGARSGS